MSLTRIAATGRGRISARLVIEGLEHVFVTDKRMERVMSDGRVCVRGLDTETLTIGASADMMRATLRGTGLTARIRDMDRVAGQRHGRVTRGLWRSPTVRGFLAADISKTATTITLRDAAAFPAAGVVHIGTEAIAYAGKSATQLTGCTRGHWQTIAQAHFVADGEGLADALVTDQPIGIEGRRAYLYLYGDGPASIAQGDGSLRWKGVVSSDVLWSAGVCEFTIDPITRLFDQPIGGDLAGTLGIRGIHYTSASPIEFTITDYAAGVVTTARARVVGFYETQRAYAEAATTAIANALTTAGISLGTDSAIVVNETLDGWRLEYRTPAASPRTVFVTVKSDLDVTAQRGPGYPDPPPIEGWFQYALLVARPGDTAWVPTVSSLYTCQYNAPVPRGTIGYRYAWAGDSAGMESITPTASFYRMYMSGLVQPTSDDVISFSAGEDAVPARVVSVDSATRSIYIGDAIGRSQYAVLDATTTISLGRSIAVGDVTDLIVQLSTDSPDTANSGAMPLVTAADVTWDDDGGTDFADAIAAQPLAQNRGFFVFDGEQTLAEIIEPELLVLGAYQRLTLTGSVEWARIRPTLATDTATWTIDDTASPAQTIEKSPRGSLSAVLYKMGFNPRDGEWDKRTIMFRDVQTTSATRTPITLEIAQRSTSSGTTSPRDDWRTLDRAAVGRIAMAAIGLFGMPTAIVTITVDARYMDARIGDTVSLSSSLLPDIDDGVSETVSRSGMIVAHSLECRSGRVELGILMHTQRFAGYAPAFLVASQTPVAGNTWDVTVTLTGYTTSTTVADWLEAGDLVMAQRPDTSGSVSGTVLSIQSATVVRVAFASAWTPSTFEWGLRTRVSTAHASADHLAAFAFNAGPDRRISFSDEDQDAQVFS